jgi:hypothetical protein
LRFLLAREHAAGCIINLLGKIPNVQGRIAQHVGQNLAPSSYSGTPKFSLPGGSPAADIVHEWRLRRRDVNRA